MQRINLHRSVMKKLFRFIKVRFISSWVEGIDILKIMNEIAQFYALFRVEDSTIFRCKSSNHAFLPLLRYLFQVLFLCFSKMFHVLGVRKLQDPDKMKLNVKIMSFQLKNNVLRFLEFRMYGNKQNKTGCKSSILHPHPDPEASRAPGASFRSGSAFHS